MRQIIDDVGGIEVDDEEMWRRLRDRNVGLTGEEMSDKELKSHLAVARSLSMESRRPQLILLTPHDIT